MVGLCGGGSECLRASAASAEIMVGGSVWWRPNNAVSTALSNAVLRLGDMPSMWLIVSVRMWLMVVGVDDRQARCSSADIDRLHVLADDWE